MTDDQKFLSNLLAEMQERMETAETDFQIRLYCKVIALLEEYIIL
jgi:hypothetical protein